MKNMKIISKTGNPGLAMVYVAQVRDDKKSLIEFVDSIDPKYPREEKWVITISTQIGCPVKCLMCDSGLQFKGNLKKEELFAQIDHVLASNQQPATSNGFLNHPKLKIQFARMGEPALNPAVLDALEELPKRYPISGLMPCIATTAPAISKNWLEHLREIKNRHYLRGRFQLQFSINSTDEKERDKIMPIRKLALKDISDYGNNFYVKGDRKVSLNFALAKEEDIDPKIIGGIFDPKIFIIKITPVNPTISAEENGIGTVISAGDEAGVDRLADKLGRLGYEVIVSIGSAEEIGIGSNCGQSVRMNINRSNREHQISHPNNSPII